MKLPNIEKISMGYKEGRSELAPEVHQVLKNQKCNRFNSTSSKITHKVRIKENSKTNNQNAQISQAECKCGCKNCWLFCVQNERAQKILTTRRQSVARVLFLHFVVRWLLCWQWRTGNLEEAGVGPPAGGSPASTAVRRLWVLDVTPIPDTKTI